MPTIHLPSQLAARAGVADVDLDAGCVADALASLVSSHPSLAGWVTDEQGTLRRHVSVFVNDARADLDTALAAADRVYIVPAISGGAPRDDASPHGDVELLVGTRKGLFVLRGPRGGDKGGDLEVVERAFAGQDVDFATADPRTGIRFAAVSHGQYGPRLFRRVPGGDWEQTEGPAFPDDAGATVSRLWIVEPGEAPGQLWAGVAPAALFESRDDGATWHLNRALWNVPGRAAWEGGAGGLALHSICPWPGKPERLAVAVSAAGVWRTDDGGTTWRWGVDGLVPRYVPEEARGETTSFCVHHMERSPRPERLYLQFHGGVYRSDDEGATWAEVSADSGLPADFGFPLVADPTDPETAWVIPLVADVDRVTPEGRLRVYVTRDAGRRWSPQGDGLPQQDAYLTVLRQAFCHDRRSPLGLYFGATSGELFASADAGATWRTASRRLPPVLSVRAV
jgi:molybdopterin converting factor small subunit